MRPRQLGRSRPDAATGAHCRSPTGRDAGASARAGDTEGVLHGRGDDRPQPKSPPRVHDRRHLRGRPRPDRDRDQVDPRPQGQPGRRVRPDRPAARPGCSACTSRRGRPATATTTRRSGRASCSLHRAQITQLLSRTKQKGQTMVPLKLYLTERGRAKLEVGLARGKQLHDRRRTSPSAIRGGTSPASSPTSSAADPDALRPSGERPIGRMRPFRYTEGTGMRGFDRVQLPGSASRGAVRPR